jgi:DNA-binding response OmpR family regulator
MKVLCVTGNITQADHLERELGKIAPQIQIDVSPTIDDALARLSAPGSYDAVLLDAVINGGDGIPLITHIRQQSLPLTVIIMTGPSSEDPPFGLLDAGADDYVLRKPNYVRNLPAILERATERRRHSHEWEVHPIEVVYTGNIQRAGRYFTHPALVKLHCAAVEADGGVILPSPGSGKFPYDAAILDDAVHGVRILRALKEILTLAPDVPAILLISPGREQLIAQGMKLGAVECIVKMGDYLRHLAASVESAVHRRDLELERVAMRSTEARLRLIIETIPTCVTRLAPDGTIQAMNFNGLAVLGAMRLDQVVGKNLFTLAGPKCEERLREFFAQFGNGRSASIVFEWEGLDGISRRLEICAASLGRESEADRTILAVIHPVGPESGTESTLCASEKADFENLKSSWEKLNQEQQARERQWEEERKILESERSSLQDALRDALEQKLQPMEARCADLEQEHAALADQLRTLEARKAQLEEQYHLERAEWDSASQAMMRQYAESEERRAEIANRGILMAKALEDLESRHTALENQHRSDQEEWEKKIQELTGQRTALEETVRQLESRQAEFEEQHRVEYAEWEKLEHETELQRAEYERLRAEMESRRAAMEEALHRLESRCALVGDQYKAELAQWDKTREQLQQQRDDAERRRTALEEVVREYETRSLKLDELHSAEKADWERVCRELSRKHAEESAGLESRWAALEQARKALEMRCAEWEAKWQAVKTECANRTREVEELQSAMAAKNETLEKTLTALEAYRKELDEKQPAEQANRDRLREELEYQRSARFSLEEMLRLSEARRGELEQAQKNERSHWLSVREESERQRSARMALEEDLRNLELRLTQLVAEHRGDRIELDALRQELQKQRAARLALEDALRAAEVQQRPEPSADLAPAVRQAVNELVARVEDCVELWTHSLGPDDPSRIRGIRLLESAGQAGKLALRLLAIGRGVPPADSEADADGPAQE